VIDRSSTRDTPIEPLARYVIALVLGTLVAETILASVQSWAHRQAGHMDASDLIKSLADILRRGGRSLIAPPSSTTSCFLSVLPCQGHGSLRGRRMPPQHLVRSTGTAMSTTGLRGDTRSPTASLAAGLHPRPVGKSTRVLACARVNLVNGLVRRPPAALTNGMARLTAKCCAGSRKASWPAQSAPFRHRTASRQPVPIPSGLKSA
jgi:hypothetical protein